MAWEMGVSERLRRWASGAGVKYLSYWRDLVFGWRSQLASVGAERGHSRYRNLTVFVCRYMNTGNITDVVDPLQ